MSQQIGLSFGYITHGHINDKSNIDSATFFDDCQGHRRRLLDRHRHDGDFSHTSIIFPLSLDRADFFYYSN